MAITAIDASSKVSSGIVGGWDRFGDADGLGEEEGIVVGSGAGFCVGDDVGFDAGVGVGVAVGVGVGVGEAPKA